MNATNVKIGGYDCLEQWGLTMTGYTVGAPEIETSTVSVPGRDGVIDITDQLFGGAVYKNRTINMDFACQRTNTTEEKYRDLLNKVHGKALNVVFDQESDWTYHGRCTVSELKKNALYAELTIEVDADPYKINISDSSIKSL